MFSYNSQVLAPDCRMAVVQACETDVDTSNAQSQQIAALGLFQMKLRDTVDFRVDFSQWLAANGKPQLTAAVWAVAATSPKTPTMSGSAFVPSGMTAVVLQAPDGAIPGDTYYLDITASIGPTTPSLPTEVALPARTLVRRIHVIVVQG